MAFSTDEELTEALGHVSDGIFKVFVTTKGGEYVSHRGSYMSAHVLLNLLNELGKSDKMRGLPSILLLFRNSFNKFNSIIQEHEC